MARAPIMIDLTPNRQLLDSNFEGYKLSLREVIRDSLALAVPPDRILLDASQYSLLHARFFGLHNHLVGDLFESDNCAYYVDAEWNVNKVYVDQITDDLIGPLRVWQVPRQRERKVGDYNVSIKFISPDIALIGDGTGLFYIVETGMRGMDDRFTVAFKGEITGEEKGFVVVDGIIMDSGQELHVLVKSIEQEKGDSHDVFSTVLHWIRFDHRNGKWDQVSLRRLKTLGHVQYASLELNGEAVYVAGDNECKFVLNSDYPIIDEPETTSGYWKCYLWKDELNNVTFKIMIPDNTNKDLIQVHTDLDKLEVKYDTKVVLCGTLPKPISLGLTTWSIERDRLQVNLIKSEEGLWIDLIKNNPATDKVLGFCIVEEAHLCIENKDAPQQGTTFSSQQIEECDFESDTSAVFERLNGMTNSVTHKANLGSHEVLLITNLSRELPPAIGIKHDVDVCIWQPLERNGDFSMSHEGTLLAFGYIQASKQNRKFLVCCPDLGYSAICESSGHIFIYRQKRAVTSGELRNRANGRIISNVAEQQVVNMSNEEILGVCPFNSMLFVLTGSSITALKF